MKKMVSLLLVLMLAFSGFSALADAADGAYTASAEGKDGPVVVETTFEGGIRRNPRSRHTRSGAGEVNDARVLFKQWQQGLSQKKWPFEVDVEKAIELRFAD